MFVAKRKRQQPNRHRIKEKSINNGGNYQKRADCAGIKEKKIASLRIERYQISTVAQNFYIYFENGTASFSLANIL